jgi:hypothetical protein
MLIISHSHVPPFSTTHKALKHGFNIMAIIVHQKIFKITKDVQSLYDPRPPIMCRGKILTSKGLEILGSLVAII